MRDEVLHAAQVIRRGGLLIYPTEGVYGIGCDPRNQTAVARLINLKQRDPGKGFILIAASEAMLSDYIAPLEDAVRAKLSRTWPGPVSWVVPARTGIHDSLTGGRETLAVRVSAHPFVQALCTELNHALISTSANVSGHPPITEQDTLETVFGDAVDHIVPMAPGDLAGPTPIYDALTGAQLR